VFAADVKGDLAGIAMPGDAKPHFVQRAKDIGIGGRFSGRVLGSLRAIRAPCPRSNIGYGTLAPGPPA
jgi:hypothetical protein